MKPQRVVILGAGGQARETAWYLDEINQQNKCFELVGFVVTDLSKLGPYDSRSQLLGDYHWIESHRSQIDGLILGIGSPTIRLKVARELISSFPELEWPTVIHPDAHFDSSTVHVERGVLIGAHVVGTVNLHLEEFSMLNFGCTLGHEVRVGRGSVVNPGANISGGVYIHENVLVGAGAVILQYLEIAQNSTIGAGAVVTKSIIESNTYVGIPARPIESFSPVSKV